MKNPNGMDTVEARRLLQEVLDGAHGHVCSDAEDAIGQAMVHLHKQKPLRRAHTQQCIKITPAIKAHVLALAPDLALSNSDIAVLVGLPKCASGRISEIIQGLR